MFQVIYTTDENILKPIYEKLYPEDAIDGVSAVLVEGDKALGLCSLAVSDVVKIKRFDLLPEYKNFANTDFFFRVILYKLSLKDYRVEVDCEDERLLKFGFKKENGKMVVLSKEIVFPSGCGGH